MTVRACLTNHFDHGGGGGGPAGSEGPAHRAVTSIGKLPMGGLPSTAGIVLPLSPGLRGSSGDGGGELSMPSSCTIQAVSSGDKAFFLFLALVILGEMTAAAGLLLDAVAVAVA